MMRPHCDRCDKLCDDYATWLEDNESPLNARGMPMVGSGTNPIWYITVDKGGSHEEKMFCSACRIAILEAHVKALKSRKLE
jgi:hypothetical protein